MIAHLRRTAAAAVAAAVLLAGCSAGGDVGSDPGNPDQLEVITWWASGDDHDGYLALQEVFAERHPGIQLIDASVRDVSGDRARAAIAARLEAGNPPDTFQSPAGAGIRAYVADGRLQDLTSLGDELGVDELFRAALLDLLRVDGRLYAVPVDVHRVNVLWSNSAVLRDAGVDPDVAPADLDGWLADLAAVRAAGVAFPLALGDGFTQLQLFECVLIADLGPAGYRELWTDPAAWESDAVHAAVGHYARLLEFTDPGTRSEDWVDTSNRIADGGAAYVVLADYAQQSYESLALVLGNDYQAAPVPGTAGVFDLLADTFTLPVGAAHERSARAWLATVATADAQHALSAIKGSIPALADPGTIVYPAYQRTAITSLREDAVVPSLAHGLAADAPWVAAVTEAVVEFGRDGRTAAFEQALAAAGGASDSGAP